jgi:drug/metabolite transporter (DMT)-like permease
MLGIMFGLVAAVCQALGAVMSRKAFAIGTSVDGITAAYQRILGGVAVTAMFFAYVKFRHPSTSSAEKRKIWPWVLANGLSGPTLGVSCYQWALKTTPTGVVLPIVALTPIVIIPFARYTEGERPTARSIIGSIIAVAGAAALALSR